MWARVFWRDFNQYSVSIIEAQFWAYLLSAKGIEINRERKCALSTIILGVKLPLQGSTHCSCIINILLIMNYTWVSPQKIRSFPNKKSKNTLQDFDHQPFTLKKKQRKRTHKKKHNFHISWQQPIASTRPLRRCGTLQPHGSSCTFASWPSFPENCDPVDLPGHTSGPSSMSNTTPCFFVETCRYRKWSENVNGRCHERNLRCLFRRNNTL